MKKILILNLLLLFLLFNLYADDKYYVYTQTFPELSEAGEDPEIVFADLIEEGKLISVTYREQQFYYNMFCCWVNDIGKIRNDCEYRIKVCKDIIPIQKKYVQLKLKPKTINWLYYIGEEGLTIRDVFKFNSDNILSIKSKQTNFEDSKDLSLLMYYGKVYGIIVSKEFTINWKINE